MGATFQLDGQEFFALNGGPQFKLTDAISLFVHCESQEEVDYFWEKLGDSGTRESAAGSRTSSDCPGRSSLPF